MQIANKENMAIVPMQKINIIGLISEKAKLLEKLQKLSVAEIVEIEPKLLKTILGENVYFPGKEALEFDIAELKFAIDFLAKYDTGKKPGLLESFIGNTIKVSAEKFRSSQTMDYKNIVASVKEIDKNLLADKNELEKINLQIEQLRDWQPLDTPIADFQGLYGFNVLIGKMLITFWPQCEKNLNKISKQIIIESIEKIEEKDKKIIIIYPRNEEIGKDINKLLSECNFASADFLFAYSNCVKTEIINLTKTAAQIQNKLQQLRKQAIEIAKNRICLMCIYDRLNWEENLKETSAKTVDTQYVFVMSAWVRAYDLPEISNDLKMLSKNIGIIKVSPEKDEQPPVDLENKKFIQPFEAVTNIYGMPRYSEPDPSPFLALFFVIFLAFCLTDAGYGLIIIILTYLMLKKVDLPDTRLVKLLHYGGWFTLVIGALAGGWFGMQLETIRWQALSDFLIHLRIIDPVKSPLAMMGVALTIGIIHVWFGIFIRFYWKIKHNEARDAWIDDAPWLCLIILLIFFALAKAGVLTQSVSGIINILLYINLGIIIFSKSRQQKNIFLKIPVGILGLYDIIGYLSDTLSYSRLLALGLATGIIGLVVNMIADLFKGIPIIGWLIFIVILVGGHTFNLAINLLGGFIHASRLQFVEFFTKFMEGGGKRFAPLGRKNIYTRIKDNNQPQTISG